MFLLLYLFPYFRLGNPGYAFEYNAFVISSDISYLMFLNIIFRLKALLIYLDKENDSEEKIIDQLANLKHTRIFYILLLALIKFFQLSGLVGMEAKFSDTLWYAWGYLILSLITIVVRVAAHVYILGIGLNLQRLLRRFKHITGYKGEVVIALYYLAFSGYLIFWQIVTPVIIFVVRTRGFECSDYETGVVFVIQLW